MFNDIRNTALSVSVALLFARLPSEWSQTKQMAALSGTPTWLSLAGIGIVVFLAGLPGPAFYFALYREQNLNPISPRLRRCSQYAGCILAAVVILRWAHWILFANVTVFQASSVSSGATRLLRALASGRSPMNAISLPNMLWEVALLPLLFGLASDRRQGEPRDGISGWLYYLSRWLVVTGAIGAVLLFIRYFPGKLHNPFAHGPAGDYFGFPIWTTIHDLIIRLCVLVPPFLVWKSEVRIQSKVLGDL